jgi:hypothetical protein
MDEPIKLVRFINKYPPYNTGEIAGFPSSVADRLIGSVAVAHVVPVQKPSIEIIPLPGGWYDVGGKRVKGKQAAVKLHVQLATDE